MNKNINIFYSAIVDRDGKEITVGGIQTYLLALTNIFLDNGYNVRMYQFANSNFKFPYKSSTIYGIKTNSKKSHKSQMKHLFGIVKANIQDDDIIIWGTDKIALKSSFSKAISIQHGISFDYISYNQLPYGKFLRNNILGIAYKWLQIYKVLREFLVTKNVICVDYNYLNWIRTILPRNYSINARVVPNFAKVDSLTNKTNESDQHIKILFARRFEEMRGVKILIPVIHTILERYKNVSFTIAGEGSFKNILLNEFSENEKVTITKYNIDDVAQINMEHQISLIPTYGSEGTSFSLLEAMASGSVPIASNVGGMTNIILDGFNGFLINPDPNQFIKSISSLIENPHELKELALNARLTVEKAFEFKLWANKWLEYVKEINEIQG